ncbi:sensor histidine kinase [Xenorhabdus doucetiae]|uniref:Inner membrane ABC transporter permease protein YejB n=1 Tax=Xenorhabdus doucetiae TaxID=351671 RepID=A0A068QRF2_9GAMM|nr:sensor histidine kinase [Xenorhabdus doucetiae]TYP03198.1 signal transduction histidine kinase [Xenorhabdus doucetiae]CDG16405.1 Inner membrane ABC transporter permease protein YejB [Xenorhabdus doucetiae]
MESISFKTRARTIDHLGREQIADCPTAISELWKNAYDAYASKVELNIFDGEIPVATLVDNGHGMDIEEFKSKWLVIGTESKAGRSITQESDRLGFPERIKQGQKGIGRLSCAALGSLLLIISKRKNSSFVAALIDWRFFENPYLMLDDVFIPIVEFDNKKELEKLLPNMFDSLLSNILGDENSIGDDPTARTLRLVGAWNRLEDQEVHGGNLSTKERVLKTANKDIFDERMLSTWSVWTGESTHGTAMFMAEIHDDLKAQIPFDVSSDGDTALIKARNSLKQTLINFTDPFSKLGESKIDDFSTSVVIWNGHVQRVIIDDVRSFDLSNLELLEHIVDGVIDDEGYFHGYIKAFGEKIEDVVIKPVRKYKTKSNTKFGAFNIRIGSYEYNKSNSTLSDDLNDFFTKQSELYGGVRIYRDGLRVMPYGREDNDYFEIEKRRSQNAGRYFWSNRRTFGRIAITRKDNPNLKDKAGREGLLDNTASKMFREVVENILISTAFKYLGRESDIRKVHLEDVAALKATQKAEADRKKLIQKERKRIKNAINENFGLLKCKLQDLKDLQHRYTNVEEILTLEDAKEFKKTVSCFNDEMQKFSLSPVPNNLGSVESDYKNYRRIELEARGIIKILDESANVSLSSLSNKTDYDIAIDIFNEKKRYINSFIRKTASLGKELLQDELNRFNDLIGKQSKIFQHSLANLLEDLNLEKVPLSLVLRKIDDEYQKQLVESNQRLIPYITAIQNIREQIDLEGLAIHSLNETAKWKQEAERLNSLAQLGITVEVIGHEVEALDSTISRGLNSLRNASFTEQEKRIFDDINYAQQSLSDKWRFLSPLKLSGEKIKKNITGKDIFDYINNFFGNAFELRGISFEMTSSFECFSITDFPSRIYPVFINLVNNSRYWVCQQDVDNKKILLDFSEGEVFVSDNGPGVDSDDIEQLFTLFFTRKHRGGRGVGLYLCRTNLQPGGHSIRYEVNESGKKLSGANFAIKFNGITK